MAITTESMNMNFSSKRVLHADIDAHVDYLEDPALPMVELDEAPKARVSIPKSARMPILSLLLVLAAFAAYSLVPRMPSNKTEVAPHEVFGEIEQISTVLNFLMHKVKTLETKSPAQAGASIQTADPSPIVAQIQSERANVRVSPSNSAEIILSMARGTQLLVNSDLGNGWLEVWLPTGNKAFLSSETCSVSQG